MASAAEDTAGHSCSGDSCNNISFGGGCAESTSTTNESIPEWQGSIPFSVFILDDTTKDISSIFDRPPQNVDICHYLEAQKYPTRRLYFCPETYPPPANDEEMEHVKSNKCAKWMSLKKDLHTAAHDAGSPIQSNGGRSHGHSLRNFRCSHAYRKMPSKGKNKRRRRSSSKPKGVCNFGFTIKWDNFGFYVNLDKRAGNPWHKNHPKPLQSMNTTSATETHNIDSSVSDTAIPTDSAGDKASEALKEVWESSCAMADKLGPEAIKKLEETLLGFQAWYND